MPTPSTSSGIITIKPSGSILIDTLTDGGERWTNSVISYSFPDSNSYWSTDTKAGYGPNSDHGNEPWSFSFLPISSSNQTYFIQALQQWENVANIHFAKVQESQNNVGDIRVAFTHTDDFNAQSWAYGPFLGAKSGDIWIERDSTSADETWAPGTYSFLTVMHEIGHALGLEHPFDNPLFPDSLDNISETIMSYSAIAGDQSSDFTFEPTTPMPLDILAIQYLYGKNNTHHNGNDEYFFNDSYTYHETIWDSGGTNDWIAYTGSQNSTIDLREGMGSYIGNPVYAISASTEIRVPNVWVAYYAIVENAYGGSGSDILYGNDAGNSLNGGNGDDQLYGGAGDDFFDWDGNLRQGNDTMYGGTGNDVYVIDSIFDTVIELPGEGIDVVWADVSYSLSSTSSVENLYLFGNQPISANGNYLSNIINGNDEGNVLTGGAGNDDLNGLRGTDILIGGTGNDILRAGYGSDELNGGAGSDIFNFYAYGHFLVDDFNTSEDLLFFDPAIGFGNLSNLVSNITSINQENDRLIVEFGQETSIEFVGVYLNEITADMIVFSL